MPPECMYPKLTLPSRVGDPSDLSTPKCFSPGLLTSVAKPNLRVNLNLVTETPCRKWLLGNL